MSRGFLKVLVLVTVVWLLFLAASSSIAYIVLAVLDGSAASVAVSVARTVAGVVVFLVWVVGWHRLTVFWLHRVLLGEKVHEGSAGGDG
ncbi:hypothetical protein CSUB_C0018 [Candidatus Caldarchaeum subterraneum]|uniref:Uncharacterized protein n=1 Tax=Caldiarchaeum subterraneum TaxID=311458 RepID=E6N394_CALS0|nr:hypothetical protein HGMM_F29E04C06 [Candidatus Caldarchaeum subterraneum]BAJ47053.1 hypothetical protein HGMM_F51C10C08 [Candidatus Caldarchaeum subterraneum]BAJ49887.1 hypothetical protein CSUB_C0018 [Candidatus Caldarchaeum subterraneum]